MIRHIPRDVFKKDVLEIWGGLPSGSVLVKTKRFNWVRDFYFLLGGPMELHKYSHKQGDMVVFSVPTKFTARK